MRYGTRTVLGRQWCAKGHRPDGTMRIGYDFGYLYAALCPATGDLFALLLPTMQSVCWETFLNELDAHCQTQSTRPITLIADNAGTHHSQQITYPPTIHLQFLPPYSPELNPCERFFLELRRTLKNKCFQTLQHIETQLQHLLKTYWDNPNKLILLTHWDWLKPPT